MEAGMSLREVEKESGVRRSEIQRLEAGSQDFRLISFLKLCAALGLPPASILDQAVSCSRPYYIERVKGDPQFSREIVSRKIPARSMYERRFASAIGSLAAPAAHLLRCSSPTVIAAYAKYPRPELQASFVKFSQKLAFEIEPLDRLSLIKGIRAAPIDTLRLLGLLDEGYITEALSSCKKGTPWTPFVLLPDAVPR